MFKEGAAMVEAEGEVMYLLALKMEGGPHPRNLGAPRNTALLTLDFCPMRPILDFRPPELQDTKFVIFFKLLSLWSFVSAAIRIESPSPF